MAVAANADDYTVGRLNIFFPAHNNTPLDGNLTGQCVTLNKWFLAEMTSVPSPFSARGHGRYVGKTLVAQGHAVEVPYEQRKRGDFICYEYGEYGHIAVQLSGGRVFEQNVNLGGVQSKIVDGQRVYASRIGSESEAWRVGKNPHIYRLKGYNEGGAMYEGRTAEDWAKQAKDAEAYKQQVIQSTAWKRGMDQNVNYVKLVIDDLQAFKDNTLANPPKPPGTVLKPGIYEVK